MKKTVFGVVYKIKNTTNNKIYIGLTTSKRGFNGRYSAKGIGVERVYNFYKYQDKNNQFVNRHLLNSIEKYGFESFEVDEEFDFAYSKEELKLKEEKWIKHYKSNNYKYGYNRTAGGDSFLSGEENPRYNSIKYKCEVCGKECAVNRSKFEQSKHHYCSVECSRTGYSNNYTGENNPTYNRIKIKCDCCSKEFYRPKSLTNSNNYCSRECKNEHQKHLLSKKGNPRSRKVICITTGKIFNTVKDGAEEYGCTRQHISKCCNGKIKYCGKLNDGTPLVWAYYDEYINQESA